MTGRARIHFAISPALRDQPLATAMIERYGATTNWVTRMSSWRSVVMGSCCVRCID